MNVVRGQSEHPARLHSEIWSLAVGQRHSTPKFNMSAPIMSEIAINTDCFKNVPYNKPRWPRTSVCRLPSLTRYMLSIYGVFLKRV